MSVRIAAVQYDMRPVHGWPDFERQVRATLLGAAEYRPDFVLFPEIFTAQLMSASDSRDLRAAVRGLHAYTPRFIALMTELAAEHDCHLIAGSHPTVRNEALYNSAYLFSPDGRHYVQDKLHRTRWETEKWETTAGDRLVLFETPIAKIAILVCYDIEFPELARQAADAGAEILFVPSCTDDRRGFLRVRHCCHARAIENPLFVAVTGTVGTLPVEGLGLNYGQAAIVTPSDFPFPRDGLAAEGTANIEQIVVADVRLDVLMEQRRNGTTNPQYDRRPAVYATPVETVRVGGD